MSTDEVVNDIYLNNELYSQEYFLQSDICRLCWSTGAHHDLHAETSEFNDKMKIQVLIKVQDCLNIDISADFNDKYPKKLCEACFSKVENFYDFKTYCRDHERKLYGIFLENNFKPLEMTAESSQVVKEEKSEEILNLPLSKSNSFSSLFDSLEHEETQLNTSEEPIKESKSKKKTKTKYKRKRNSSYCNICHVDFNSEDLLNTHNSEAHGIEPTGLFKCFGCDRRFKTRGNRLCHELQYCKQLKDGYKCNICDRFLPKRRMYELHVKSHKSNKPVDLPEDIFQCAKCMKKFTTKISLMFHLKAHGAENIYVCETCGRVFSRLDYLNKHVATHTGVRRYQCPQCPYRSTQPSALTVHIRKHTGERPYPCDLCPQRCVSSSNLVAHRRRHLAVQDYQCTICPKKFGYKSSLEDHIAATHERSRPHVCSVCGASYTRQRGLRRHEQTKHGIEPKQCGRVPKTIGNSKNSIEKSVNDINNQVFLQSNVEKSIEFS